MSALAVLGLAVALVGGASCLEIPLPPRLDISTEAQARRSVYGPMVQEAACRNGVSPLLLDALVIQESRYNPRAVSSAGAIGLGQLMPGTAQMLRVDPWKPRENLDGAARYLRQQLDEFGSVRLALAAYNAGPGRVRRAGRVPSITETINYVATIERDLRETSLLPAAGERRPAVVVNLSAETSRRDPDGAQGGMNASEGDSRRTPPPHWDVFARFAFERASGAEQERTD